MATAAARRLAEEVRRDHPGVELHLTGGVKGLPAAAALRAAQAEVAAEARWQAPLLGGVVAPGRLALVR